MSWASPITVVVGIIQKKDKVLIQKRTPGSWMEGRWEFPGGKVRPTLKCTYELERELYEELGLTFFELSDDQLWDEFKFCYPGMSEAHLKFFKIKATSEEPVAREGQHYEWVQIMRLPMYDFIDADYRVAMKLMQEFLMNKVN